MDEISSKHILAWIACYLIMWIASGLMLNQLVSIFKPGDIYQTLYLIGAWTLSSSASMLTIFLPSGLGLKEIATTGLLSVILPLPLAGTVAILMRFLATFLEIVVSATFYLIGLRSPRLRPILNPREKPQPPS